MEHIEGGDRDLVFQEDSVKIVFSTAWSLERSEEQVTTPPAAPAPAQPPKASGNKRVAPSSVGKEAKDEEKALVKPNGGANKSADKEEEEEKNEEPVQETPPVEKKKKVGGECFVNLKAATALKTRFLKATQTYQQTMWNIENNSMYDWANNQKTKQEIEDLFNEMQATTGNEFHKGFLNCDMITMKARHCSESIEAGLASFVEPTRISPKLAALEAQIAKFNRMHLAATAASKPGKAKASKVKG